MTIAHDTLAARLTSLAPGAIAVIALAGPDVASILAKVLRSRNSDESAQLAVGRTRLCRVVDSGEVIDDAVAVLVRSGPDAYAEICTHGGVRVAQRVELLLARCGATIVEPAALPHPFRAIDPVRRDIDEALLRSNSRRLTHWLLHQRESLPGFMARRPTLSDDEMQSFIGRSESAIRLLRGLTVAIVGPPNAGKSTLANRLIGRDRVITSDQPGTTRDWVSETALINGWPVTLTDTAGIRETSCEIETEAIRRGREQAAKADAVLIVLDSTDDRLQRAEVLRQLTASLSEDIPRLVVLNKSDASLAAAVGQVEQRDLPIAHQGCEPRELRISALQGNGMEALERALGMSLGLHILQDKLPTAITRAQLDGLRASPKSPSRP